MQHETSNLLTIILGFLGVIVTEYLKGWVGIIVGILTAIYLILKIIEKYRDLKDAKRKE